MKYEMKVCGGCGAEEGQFHEPGCNMEKCPFCGGQLISCGCLYRKLYGDVYRPQKWVDNHFEGHLTSGLPKDVYYNGPPEDVMEKWEQMLEEKGKIPYIRYPLVCCYCGVLWPDLFQVEDAEWEKYIQPDMRDKILCEQCYNRIKTLVDANFKRFWKVSA